MKTSAFSKTRGDTVKIPVLVTIPTGVTVRVHLRQTAESETFFNLSIVEEMVIIPETVSSCCLGLWGFDIELTNGDDEVETVQRTKIEFTEDYSRVYGAEASEPLSDFERKTIIAKDFKYRKADNTIESIPSVEDFEAITNEEASRVTHESTRQSNETARGNAESNRTSAETTRGNNESTRQSNETARGNAESNRASAETTRGNNESTRQSNETARGNAEGNRASAETTRGSNESNRQMNETARGNAESNRVSAETTRGNNESTRQTNELGRTDAETSRVSNEGIRSTQETTRQTQEVARQISEANRVALTVSNKPLGSWSAATNTPTLTNGSGGVAGTWYVCQVGATWNGDPYVSGDAILCNAALNWVRIPSYKAIASLIEAMTGVDGLKFITADLLYFYNKLNQVPYQGAIDDLDMGIFNAKSNQFTAKGYLGIVQSLTYASTINFDFTSGSDGVVTLTGNVTLALANIPDTASGTITIIQGSGGSKLLTSITHSGLTVVYRGGVSTLTTTAGKADKIRYERTGAILYVTLDLNY